MSINTYNLVHCLIPESLRALSIFVIGNQNLLSSNWKYKTKSQKIKEIVIINNRSLKVAPLVVFSFSSRSYQYTCNSFRFSFTRLASSIYLRYQFKLVYFNRLFSFFDLSLLCLSSMLRFDRLKNVYFLPLQFSFPLLFVMWFSGT